MIAGVAHRPDPRLRGTTGLNVVDVRDVARGHALACERGSRGERYLLGGVNLPLDDLFAAIADLAGRPRPRLRVPTPLPSAAARAGLANRDEVRLARLPMYFSCEKAQSMLGYQPGPVEPALARAVREALSDEREGRSMKFPLRSTVQIGRYVASQKEARALPARAHARADPRLQHRLHRLREDPRVRVEQGAADGRGVPRLRRRSALRPVVSICGGEPLIFKGIEEVVAGFLEMKKNIQLCTNALRLEELLDGFKPNPRLTFVVHLDGMREIHDYICDYPGLWDIAIDAIKTARESGFRVTTNTTIFKETEVDDVIEMMRYLTNEVGIDGMLVAPGYQYSQIDPDADDDARRARGEVPRHPRRRVASTATGGSRAPIYQDFLTGERSCPARRGARSPATRTAGRARATCSPTGSSRPTTRSSTGSSGSATGPATTRAASTAASTAASSRRRPSRRPRASRRRCGASRGRCGRRLEPADARLRARGRGAGRAQAGGARTARVGLGARAARCRTGRSSAFGLAGALVRRLEPGTLVYGRPRSSTRTAPSSGRASRSPCPARGRPSLCAAARVVDEPDERARCSRSERGAVAVDMESGVARRERAARRRRARDLRHADRPVGRPGAAPRRRTAASTWPWSRGVPSPSRVRAIRARVGARRGLAALERAAAALAEGCTMNKRVLIARAAQLLRWRRARDRHRREAARDARPAGLRSPRDRPQRPRRPRPRGARRDLRRVRGGGPGGRARRPLRPRRRAAVYRKCAERNLQVVDATCPLVSKVHAEARRYAAAG